MFIKLYEEFVSDNRILEVIKELENRVKYWFNNGSISDEVNVNEIEISTSTKHLRKYVMFNFNNDNYMFQVTLTIESENPDKCEFEIKRYDLDTVELIDKITDEVDIDEVKEDLLISKISEFEDKPENPDENKIEINSEEDEEEDVTDKGQDGQSQQNEFDFGEPQGSNFELGGVNQPQGQFEEEEFEF